MSYGKAPICDTMRNFLSKLHCNTWRLKRMERDDDYEKLLVEKKREASVEKRHLGGHHQKCGPTRCHALISATLPPSPPTNHHQTNPSHSGRLPPSRSHQFSQEKQDLLCVGLFLSLILGSLQFRRLSSESQLL